MAFEAALGDTLRNGNEAFERRRQEERLHILETTGEALRGRMSWL